MKNKSLLKMVIQPLPILDEARSKRGAFFESNLRPINALPLRTCLISLNGQKMQTTISSKKDFYKNMTGEKSVKNHHVTLKKIHSVRLALRWHDYATEFGHNLCVI